MAQGFSFLKQMARGLVGSVGCYSVATLLSNQMETEESYKINISRYILLKSQKPKRLQVERLDSSTDYTQTDQQNKEKAEALLQRYFLEKKEEGLSHVQSYTLYKNIVYALSFGTIGFMYRSIFETQLVATKTTFAYRTVLSFFPILLYYHYNGKVDSMSFNQVNTRLRRDLPVLLMIKFVHDFYQSKMPPISLEQIEQVRKLKGEIEKIEKEIIDIAEQSLKEKQEEVKKGLQKEFKKVIQRRQPVQIVAAKFGLMTLWVTCLTSKYNYRF